MQKPISRRRFLTQATAAAGGAAIMAASAGASASKKKSGLQPYRPGTVEILENEEHLKDYQALTRQPVYKMQIVPHWSHDNTRFWYTNALPRGRKEFIKVDAARGLRAPAFDHKKLAVGMTKATGKSYTASKLPFDSIALPDDGKSVRFAVDGTDWQCDLETYVCSKTGPTTAIQNVPTNKSIQPEEHGASPDQKWTARVKDHNLFVRVGTDGNETALTHDGTAERPYGAIDWAPDGKTFVAYRIDPVAIKPVFMVESSPKAGGTRGILHQHEYAQPGDPFPSYEMWVFDPATASATKAQVETINFDGPPSLRWNKDGSRFTFERMDRGYQRFRVIAVQVRSGANTTLVDDQAKTFVDSTTTYVNYVNDGAEILYASERDGWRHLYRFNGYTGALMNQITQGPWVLRGVDQVDENSRHVWFSASGRNAGEDPYHLHHYRANFDGTELVALTQGDGNHQVQCSPDRHYVIDSYSRVDLPPVHTLRRASDGTHLCDLESADISSLMSGGWRSPEVFHSPGRDGRTDIWGVVFRPTHFNSSAKYPVIENIYAGPQDSFVRKSFSVQDGMQSLAELGFIVVQCDGMGTRNRSKVFQDVCWRNIKDAGLPDRIAWITALANKYPQLDLGRVGIYGTSAGGQSSTGALLFHPEFYKVGVSSCGCHDNRIDKQWWNEQWMGYPVGPWYADNSNITHAANLRGKLMLIVGELDSNVPPESTLRLTDALMKAGKDFELLVIPGSDHTSGGTYGERRRRDFFIRHLLGTEPPDRNLPAQPIKAVLMSPRPVSEASEAQAVDGDETHIQFHNLTGKHVELFWLSGDGKRTSYGTLAPGGNRDIHTFAGHSWLVVGAASEPIALFVGESRPGIAEIR